MAGWTIFPIDDGTDWSALTFQNEIRSAIQERCESLGFTGNQVPKTISAGKDIQSRNYIGEDLYTPYISDYGMQQVIESICPYFVATIDSSGNPVTDYDGAADIEMWDWDKIKTRVLGGNSWSRKRVNYSGAVEANGRISDGDYIGKWVWSEMGGVLNQLRWTTKEITYTRNGEANARSGYGLDIHVDDSKSEAEDEYINVPKHTTSAGLRRFSSISNSGVSYATNMINYYQYTVCNNIPTGLSKEVELYFKTSPFSVSDENTLYQFFTEGGVDYLKEGVYGKYPTPFSLAQSDSEIPSDTCIGDATHSLVTWPPFLGTYASSALGWTITNAKAVLKWDVSGGYTYY